MLNSRSCAAQRYLSYLILTVVLKLINKKTHTSGKCTDLSDMTLWPIQATVLQVQHLPKSNVCVWPWVTHLIELETW